MRTTVEIDEAVLRQAEQQARQQGKSLGMLLEEALRSVIQPGAPASVGATSSEAADGLEPDDPFFAALEEARRLWSAPGRDVPELD